eukprot:6648205-Pyramimonas_sp.AAC.1
MRAFSLPWFFPSWVGLKIAVRGRFHVRGFGCRRLFRLHLSKFKRPRVAVEVVDAVTQTRQPLTQERLVVLADKMARYTGKQMQAPYPISGRTPDAYIDKEFKRLSENDVYEDPSKTAAKLSKRAGKAVTEKPFLPSSPAPR